MLSAVPHTTSKLQLHNYTDLKLLRTAGSKFATCHIISANENT